MLYFECRAHERAQCLVWSVQFGSAKGLREVGQKVLREARDLCSAWVLLARPPLLKTETHREGKEVVVVGGGQLMDLRNAGRNGVEN